jgi:hypothetical protein
MYPYVALRCPTYLEIHTLITLGIRLRTKPLVLKARMHCPCGFDSHRPLHFQPSLANASQLDFQLTSGGTLVDVG